MQIEGHNYLLATDTDTSSELDAKHSSLLLDKVLDVMSNSQAATKIIVLDACRNNPWERRWHRSDALRGLAWVYAPKGTIIGFATSPGEVAFDGTGRNGTYTDALLQHIDTPDCSIETMFKRVRNTVAAATAGKQTSWEHTSLSGEFYFNLSVGKLIPQYSGTALSDSLFVLDEARKSHQVIAGLKSHNWPLQNQALELLTAASAGRMAPDNLFVIGRNIYQAACGGSHAASAFVKNFLTSTRRYDAAKRKALTSEKNSSPYSAAARAVLDCASPGSAPFTTDYRWNGSLRYTVSPAASQTCTVGILYYRATQKGWVQALGLIRVNSIVESGLPPAQSNPIVFNGRDIAGTTQYVSVGEPIALSGTPGLSPVWKSSGSIVAGYSPAPQSPTERVSPSTGGPVEVAEAAYNQANIQFHWWKSDRQTVSYTVRQLDGTTSIADAQFVVQEPTEVPRIYFIGPVPPTPNAPFTISSADSKQPPGTQQVAFGGDPSRPFEFKGMNFWIDPWNTDTPSGNFHWLQLVVARGSTDGKICQQDPGLDNGYPIDGDPLLGVFGDAARFDLTVGSLHVIRTVEASTYLMWQSSRPGSIPVPLWLYEWGYEVDAHRASTGVWSVSGRRNGAYNFNSMIYLRWERLAVNASCQ